MKYLQQYTNYDYYIDFQLRWQLDEDYRVHVCSSLHYILVDKVLVPLYYKFRSNI